jgi:hypothetical protein
VDFLTPEGHLTKISASGGNFLALDSTGKVWHCGESTYGASGAGFLGRIGGGAPERVKALSGVNIIDVAVGGQYFVSPNPEGFESNVEDNTCLALRDDGVVLGWGHNAHGQLGIGHDLPVYWPVEVFSAATIVKMHVGAHHAMLVDNAGRVWTAGGNSHGQLGRGTVGVESFVWGIVGGIPATAIDVSAGQFESLVLMSDGTVRGFGDGSQWQLGPAVMALPTQQTVTPVTIPGITDCVEVKTKSKVSWFRTSLGQIFYWGYVGLAGRWGFEYGDGQSTPAQVFLDFEITGFFPGTGSYTATPNLAPDAVVCAGLVDAPGGAQYLEPLGYAFIGTDGRLYTWGTGFFWRHGEGGQIEFGSVADQLPLNMSGLEGVTYACVTDGLTFAITHPSVFARDTLSASGVPDGLTDRGTVAQVSSVPFSSTGIYFPPESFVESEVGQASPIEGAFVEGPPGGINPSFYQVEVASSSGGSIVSTSIGGVGPITPPTNWFRPDFDDSGWNSPSVISSGPPGGTLIYNTPAPLHDYERTLYRQWFSVPSDPTIHSAWIVFNQNDAILDVYVNGFMVSSEFESGSAGVLQRFLVPQRFLIIGSANLLAFQLKNGRPGVFPSFPGGTGPGDAYAGWLLTVSDGASEQDTSDWFAYSRPLNLTSLSERRNYFIYMRVNADNRTTTVSPNGTPYYGALDALSSDPVDLWDVDPKVILEASVTTLTEGAAEIGLAGVYAEFRNKVYSSFPLPDPTPLDPHLSGVNFSYMVDIYQNGGAVVPPPVPDPDLTRPGSAGRFPQIVG